MLPKHITCHCRATYAAEQSVQKLEKGKKEQDLLIDHLHQQVRTQEQQIAIYTQQYEAQRRESRAAKEMLAGAEADMEGIHFEKKQLTAQWQSSLIATQRRDQALRVNMLRLHCCRTASKHVNCLWGWPDSGIPVGKYNSKQPVLDAWQKGLIILL